MTLDGKFVAMLGISGHEMSQVNWPHGASHAWVADVNSWRVQKIVLKGGSAAATASR